MKSKHLLTCVEQTHTCEIIVRLVNTLLVMTNKSTKGKMGACTSISKINEVYAKIFIFLLFGMNAVGFKERFSV